MNEIFLEPIFSFFLWYYGGDNMDNGAIGKFFLFSMISIPVLVFSIFYTKCLGFVVENGCFKKDAIKNCFELAGASCLASALVSLVFPAIVILIPFFIMFFLMYKVAKWKSNKNVVLKKLKGEI